MEETEEFQSSITKHSMPSLCQTVDSIDTNKNIAQVLASHLDISIEKDIESE